MELEEMQREEDETLPPCLWTKVTSSDRLKGSEVTCDVVGVNEELDTDGNPGHHHQQPGYPAKGFHPTGMERTES